MSKELEDIFREGLGDMHSNPSPQTWKKIKNRLWWKDIVHVLSTASVEPSASVWTAISFRLWLSHFLRFNYRQLNVYYMAAAGLVTAGIIISSPFSETLPGTKLSSVNQIPDYTLPQNTGISDAVLTVNRIAVVNALPTGTTDSKHEESVTAGYPVLQPSAGLTAEAPELKTIPSRKKGLDYLHFPEVIMSNDSIVNWKGEPVCTDPFRWSADVFFAASDLRMKTKIRSNNDQFINDMSEMPTNMFTAGAGLNFQKGHFSLHGGFAYTHAGFSTEYNALHYKTDTVVISWITDGGFFQYDTLWVLNLDSLINGNPTYIAVIDSHFVHTSDTLSVNKPVTTKEVVSGTALTRISYIEIPLLAGYSLTSGKLSYRVKAGLIPGLLFYSKGNMANPYAKYGDMPADREVLSQWSLSGYTSFEIHYQPFARMGFSAEPFYRHSLTGLFNKDFPYQTRLSAVGCRFAIRYYIR